MLVCLSFSFAASSSPASPPAERHQRHAMPIVALRDRLRDVAGATRSVRAPIGRCGVRPATVFDASAAALIRDITPISSDGGGEDAADDAARAPC